MRVIKIILLIPLLILSYQINAQLSGSGNALRNGHITIPQFESLGYPFSITMWATDNVIVSIGNGNPANSVIQYDGESLIIRGMCGTTPCNRQFSQNACNNVVPPTVGLTHWAVSVTSPTQAQIYRDGVSCGTLNITGTFTNTALNYNNTSSFIGRQPNTANNITTEVDEVTFWNKALTQNEVRTYMCSKVDPTEQNLVAYYHFDEPNLTVPAAEQTTNGYTGTYFSSAQLVRSKVPLGNESSFVYGNPLLQGQHINHINSHGDTLGLIAFNGTANGYHLYTIDSFPDQTHGIPDGCLLDRYFGAYFVRHTSAVQFSYGLIFRTNNYSRQVSYRRILRTDTNWLPLIPSIILSNGINFATDRSAEFIMAVDYYVHGLNDVIYVCDFPDTLNINDFLLGDLHWDDMSTSLQRIIYEPGIYTITTTDTCGFFQVDSIEIRSAMDTIIDTNYLCKGDTLIYRSFPHWESGTYYFDQLNARNCTTTYILELIVSRIDTAYIFEEICSGESVIVNGSSFTSPGIHHINIAISPICDSVIELDITVHPSLDETYEKRGLCFVGDSVLFGDTYYSSPGMHNITLETQFGCDSVIILEIVNEYDYPFGIVLPEVICKEEPALLQVNYPAHYIIWNTGDTASFISVDKEGWYSATAATNCGYFEDEVFITFTPCDDQIFIPNAFTPNDDGRNDYFEIKGQHIVEYELYIYNRWGQMVFTSNNINHFWDGKVNGNPSVKGVYSYTLKAVNIRGKEVSKTGTFTLIR